MKGGTTRHDVEGGIWKGQRFGIAFLKANVGALPGLAIRLSLGQHRRGQINADHLRHSLGKEQSQKAGPGRDIEHTIPGPRADKSDKTASRLLSSDDRAAGISLGLGSKSLTHLIFVVFWVAHPNV